jgi:hypothetical protein
VVAIAAVGLLHFVNMSEPVSHQSSPAFQTLLTEAIARLEGVTQEVTVATVGEAHADNGRGEAMQTVDPEPTCDAACETQDASCATQDPGTNTCDPGEYTCDPAGCASTVYPDCSTTDPGCETTDPAVCETLDPMCDTTDPNCLVPTMFGYDTCDRNNPDCWGLTYEPSMPTCEPGLVTCDAVSTCSRFYTCDSQYTCHGEATCDGYYTCWSSTCIDAETCDGTPDCCQPPYTFQGNFTCDGTPTCHLTCGNEGWPTCGTAGLPTCDGTDTCDDTCDGWLGCFNGGPSGSDRTTWGQLKKDFSE